MSVATEYLLDRGNPVERDPLLRCLAFFAKHYGKPRSISALSAGLPLNEGRLELKNLARASARAGLSTKLVKQTPTEVADQLLPCIVLLEDGNAAILLEKDHQKGTAKVAWPELDEGEDRVSLEKLESLSNGYLIYVKKRYRFDDRAPKQLVTKAGHWFWDTILRSAPLYRDALLASFFVNLLAVASPLFVMNVYDRVVPNVATDTLWVLSLGMLVVIAFDFVFKQLRARLLDIAAKKSDILLSSRLFEKILNLKMSARPPSVGGFARNVQDFDSIRDFIASATIGTLIDIPFGILMLLVIGLVAGPVVYVPIVAIVVMVVFSVWMSRKMAHHVDEGSRLTVQKNAHLYETLSGVEPLKMAGAESQFQSKWEEIVANISVWQMEIKRYASTVSNTISFVQQISAVLIVIVGVYQIVEGNISMGGIIAAVMLGQRVLAPFAQVSLLATRYNQAKSALNGLDELMKQPEEALDNYLHRPYIDGRIDFEHVGFKYPNSDLQVLSGLNFTIKPQEKVAIIGRVGSGKTSIQKLLAQFYSPTEGSIRVDGIDIHQLSPAELRQKIGCLQQDINLFYGSIRDNITLGVPHVEDERILMAAKLAGVNRFTDQHPEGLDRQVGERGQYLSGGQRQAVALARALLFNPPLLLLDEPTSNFDNQSESEVKRNLALLAKEKTLVLITHKMSMLDLVDRVIVLDGGRVVIDGNKETVLKTLKGGKVHVPR